MLEIAISVTPRHRAWTFSSATPASPSWSTKTDDHVGDRLRPVCNPVRAARSAASSLECSDEYTDGIDTPCTFSPPIASTANAATTAESIPPDRAMTDRGEAALPGVVTQSQDQCVPHLRLGVEWLDHHRRHRFIGSDSVRILLGLRRRQQNPLHHNRFGHSRFRPVALGDLQVDHRDLLDELGRPGHHRAVGQDHHRTAVEDQVVLPADQVDVDKRRADLGSPTADHPDAHVVLVPLVGRGVRHQQHVDLAGQRRHGSTGLPDVLAHHDPEVHARAIGSRSFRYQGRTTASRRTPRSWAGDVCGCGRPRRRRG